MANRLGDSFVAYDDDEDVVFGEQLDSFMNDNNFVRKVRGKAQP